MKKTYWIALNTIKGGWSDQPQYPVYGEWKDVVTTAKLHDCPTRLSESKGFNNQGHYFYPDNEIKGKF